MLDLLPVRALSKDVLYPFVFTAAELQENWSTVEPFLERSVKHSFGMINLKVLQQMLFTGDATCIGTARDGYPVFVLVIHPVRYSNFITARIIAAAGREIRQSMEFFHVVDEWARCVEATEVEAWCRPAVARLLKSQGFNHRVAIITRSVRRSLQ